MRLGLTLLVFGALALASVAGVQAARSIAVAPAPEAACAPGTCTWERIFGTEGDDKAYGLVRHQAGGFVVAGNSRPANGQDYDPWIMRFSEAGDVLWKHSFNEGSKADQIYDLAQSPDGGLLAVGHTNSQGAGESDVWLLDLDAEGQLLRQRTLGGPGNDRARAVTPTADGGFLVAGFTASKGAGDRDLWLIRLGPDREVLWDRTYGGPGDDGAFDVITRADGSILLAGQRWGAGYDIWILELTPDGAPVWERVIDTDRFEAATTLAELPDGSLAVAGAVGVEGSLSDDLWLARLRSDGQPLWTQRLGGPERDTAWALDVTEDGQLLVAAATWTGDQGAGDAWILSFDARGQKRWERRFGGHLWDKPTGILALPDGIAVVGHTSSRGFGFEDGWLLRLNLQGRL